MAQRLVELVPEEFYHIYNRGNSKQVIFKDDFDYQRFQILLYLSNSYDNFKIENLRRDGIDFLTVDRKERLVNIGAYCLMPNHFHILLEPLVEGGVSLFMKKLCTGYAMFFNKRYERTGTLFEGRFKARWIDTDEYLRYVFSYIHLNPMKLQNPEWKNITPTSAMYAFINEYRFSSFWDFLQPEKRREYKIINPDFLPGYFLHETNTAHVHEWFRARTDLAQDS